MCDLVNKIFVKNIKGKGNISWRDTWVTPSDTYDTAFLAYFLKFAFQAISVEPSKTGVLKQLWVQMNRKQMATTTNLG